MSRAAAARTNLDRAARKPRTAAPPRRVSGPARPPRGRVDAAMAMPEGAFAPHPVPRPHRPARPPLRIAAGGASIARRMADATLEVSGSRTMDNLVRSRAWVVIVAFGLIGIVAMQVSMLKLNNGIGRAVETAATLERSNVTLREEVSRLSSGDRIQALAGERGFVMPEPGDVAYLSADSSSAVRAARRMSAPDPQNAGPAGSAVLASALAPDAAATTGPAAAGTTPPATAETTAPATTAPVTTPPVTTAPAGGATAPVTTPPAGGATAPTAATGAATPTPVATAPVPSGGVTGP
jgi:cell division protein FtsB